MIAPPATTSHSARPGARSANRLSQAVALVGAVRAALQTGLLEALERWQPCSASELATRAHLSRRAVDLTLAALSAGGVVAEEDDGTWSLAAPATAWSTVVAFEHHICRFVESGSPLTADEGRYTEVLPVIGRFQDRVAVDLAPSLARPHGRVLELGAGTAPWSRALLSTEPTMHAVAVDLPPVAAQLERSITGTSFAERLTCHAADVRELSLRGPFDVIVNSGLCRLLRERENARLLVRCRELLGPDGELVISDALAGTPDPDGSLALYTLGLAARSAAERLWTAADYEHWLARAGFAPPRLLPTDRPEVSVLIAGALTNQKDHP